MISDAINDSDRLSSCNKQVRKKIAPDAGVFQVFSVVVGGSAGQNGDASGEPATEEMRLNYNVGGICLSESAFNKLRQELSLAPWAANGAFRKIVIRKNRIAQVDVRDLSILRWTDRYYYEVCANPAVYAALPGEKSATASR